MKCDYCDNEAEFEVEITDYDGSKYTDNRCYDCDRSRKYSARCFHEDCDCVRPGPGVWVRVSSGITQYCQKCNEKYGESR